MSMSFVIGDRLHGDLKAAMAFVDITGVTVEETGMVTVTGSEEEIANAFDEATKELHVEGGDDTMLAAVARLRAEVLTRHRQVQPRLNS